jgi:sugar phosphate isomerase/epimerase
MMRDDLVICQQVIQGRSGADDLRLARDAGFASVSLHSSRLGERPVPGWLQLLADLELTVSGFMAIRNILADPVDASDTITAAAALGARYVVVTAGPRGNRTEPEADEICSRWFERMQPTATEAGIRLAIEPLHPLLAHQSYVHSVSHARRLTRQAGAGIVVDTAHLWWDQHLLDDFVAALDAVVSVQLGEVDPGFVAIGRYDRVPFGTGAVPNAALTSAFDSAGYKGPYEHETLMAPDGDRLEELVRSRRWLESTLPWRAA